MKSDTRAKLIEQAVKLIWSSLASHLSWTYTKHPDSKRFHKKCVKEYADLIKIITELY